MFISYQLNLQIKGNHMLIQNLTNIYLSSVLYLLIGLMIYIGDSLQLDSLQISLVGDDTINQNAIYQWTFTFDQQPTIISSFTLIFPQCITAQQGNIAVYDLVQSPKQQLTVQTINQTKKNQITFDLLQPTTNKQYSFQIDSMKNCYYSGDLYDFYVLPNILDVPLTQNNAQVLIINGFITDLTVSFDGVTGQTPSTAYFDFTVPHPVFVGQQDLIIQLQYGIYQYHRLLDIFQNSLNPQSSIIVNDIQRGTDTCYQQSNSMQCRFNNVSLSQNDKVRIVFYEIQNPLTTDNYLKTDFKITTLAMNNNEKRTYDISKSCTQQQVQIATHQALFSTTSTVNTYILLNTLHTIDTLDQFIRTNDIFTFNYDRGNLTSSKCGTTISFGLQRDRQKVTFSYNGLDSTGLRKYIANRENDNYGEITSINFNVCQFGLPQTTQPVSFEFEFSTNYDISKYSAYMKIIASITPTAGQFEELIILPNSYTIKQYTTYTVGITTGEPLGDQFGIKIIFPFDFNLDVFDQDISDNCQVTIQNSKINNPECLVDQVNQILIKTNTVLSLAKNSQIQISLHNIQNPPHPIQYTQFDIITLYNASQQASIVQKVQNVSNLKYQPQIADVTIVQNSFAVSTQQNLQIIYIPQNQLTVNSKIIITFESSISGVKLISQDNTYEGQQTGSSWQIVIKETIDVSTQIPIDFQFTSPSKTGVYSCFSLVTEIDGLAYETTSQPVQLIVDQTATQQFSILTTNVQTDGQAEYIFKFKELVPHEIPYLMQIKFPSDTDIANKQALYNGGCQDLIDISSGGVDIIQVTINTDISQDDNIRNIRIWPIINRRSVGQSDQFQITTLTSSKQQISVTYSTVYISQPNQLTAYFSPLNSYYRQNSDQVQIILQLSDLLQENDYAKITFSQESYQDINSNITCLFADCDFEEEGTDTIVRMIPSSSQILSLNITFTILGLVSNSVTSYGETHIVYAQLYSSQNQLMSKGNFYYKISCDNIEDKMCKECNQFQCLNCYDTENFLQRDDGNICTNNCGDNSLHQTYQNSGQCQPCISPCQTCASASICKTCIINHFFYSNGSCLTYCDTALGYYIKDQIYCFKCQDQANCLECFGSNGENCTVCITGMANYGICVSFCNENQFQIDNVCIDCDISCLTCQNTSTSCLQCNYGYNSVNGECLSSCPIGSVNLISGDQSICTCTGDCQQCVDQTDKCIVCSDQSLYLYDYGCLEQCPLSTYILGRKCVDCQDGCYECSKTTCIQCDANYYIYNNQCYSDCKQISERFIKSELQKKCVQCPEGCNNCDEISLNCTGCINDTNQYVLTDQGRCVPQCEIDRTCNLEQETDPIVPLPGMISVLVWSGVVAIVWIFINKMLYVPYSLIFVGCLLQFFVVFYAYNQASNKILSLETARLLQQISDVEYLNTSLILLLTWIGFNYLGNVVHLLIFYKYTKPMIPKRQLHIVTNYITLIIATLTCFRFSLIAYSRMFPTPYLQIIRSDKLKPMHILCGVYYFGIDMLLFVTGIILVVNAKTDNYLPTTYMLGIDLIILVLCFIILFIYVLMVPKNQEYYKEIKKYVIEQVYNTEENINEKSQKQIENNETNKGNQVEVGGKPSNIKNKEQSQTNLFAKNQNVFSVDDVDIDAVNDDLPTANPNVLRIIPHKPSTSSYRQDKQTQRKYKKNSKRQGQDCNAKIDQDESDLSGYFERKKKDQQEIDQKYNDSILFSDAGQEKQDKKMPISNTISYQNIRNKKHNNKNKDKDKKSLEKSTRAKQNHYSQSTLVKNKNKIIPDMKKKNAVSNNYQASERADHTNIDQVDFQSIIQTKMIDRSGLKGSHSNRHKTTKSQHQYDIDAQHQQISPSWFNIQNQRYDLEGDQSES